MNRLKRIQALNFKGSAIDANLTPLTAIVGPNTGGKSAIGAAVTIALLGHLPALGKQGGKTVQLMTPGAPMLDVQALLESGERINRRFDVNPKTGAVKTNFTGPDFADVLNPCQLDFDQFKNAKPTERQRVLEGLLVATADADVAEDARTRIAKSGLDIPVTIADGWLQKLEADAKETAKLLKQESDTAAKTILQLQGEEAPAGHDPEALEKTQKALAAAREALGNKRQAFDALAEAQQQAPDKPDGDEVTEAAIAAAADEVERLQGELQAIITAATAYRAACDQRDEILRPHAGIEPVEAAAAPMTGEELVAGQRRINDQKTELRVAMGKLQNQLQTAERELKETKARREELCSVENCPTCGTKGRDFHQAVSELLDGAIAEKEGKVATITEELETMTRGVDAFVEIEAAHLAKVKEREQHAAHLAHVRAAKVMEGVTKPTVGTGPAEAALTDATRKLTALRSDARQWIEYRAAKIPTAEQVTAAEAEWRTAVQTVEALEASETSQKAVEASLSAWRGNQAKMAELERDNVKRASEMEAAKELATWAKTKSLELTAAAMRPLLDVCNRVLAGLVEGEIAIDGTVVGVKRDGHLIPLEVLSGSEAAALSAAIQIAIAGTSVFRIVLIDELSRFGTERKKRFIDNLAEALRVGQLDQVIVFDHDGLTSGFVDANAEVGSTITVA